jgi:2-polyprenyl-6-methoxyphenol hydroxylase-like FAD-dependent oxidoreductase
LGLNSGIGDVHNIAYKIAAVHHGWATSAILDTYQDDRRQVAEINSKQSVKNGKKIFSLLKAMGTTGVEVSQARKNFIQSLTDPIKRAFVDAEIEGQEEHFDNVSCRWLLISNAIFL